MDLYLFLAPLLLLPVLLLWRLTGCSIVNDPSRHTMPRNAGVCTRADLTSCAAGEHRVEFVVVFDPAGRAKEDLAAVYELEPTVAGVGEMVTTVSPVEECPNDFGFPSRDPEGRERFVFFRCIPELSTGEYRVRCRVVERSGGFTVIDGTCRGPGPTAPDTRVEFIASAGDLELTPRRCFEAP